ncbi:MAG: hypothetical protein U1E72_00980 [Burkholderiaceae bacterium]
MSILKYAACDLLIVPSADTGPLSDVVVPIFSSVAVTPGLACARASPGRAIDAAAAAAPPRKERRSVADMVNLLCGRVAVPRGGSAA